jgi:fimbrial isopeptide formation D2 family protein
MFELYLKKTATPTSSKPGDIVTYTIAYQVPATSGNLTSVVLTDTIADDRIEYLVGSCGLCAYNQATKTLTWNLGNLNSQATGSVTFKVRIKDSATGGPSTNIAIAKSPELISVNIPQVTSDATIMIIPPFGTPRSGGFGTEGLTFLILAILTGAYILQNRKAPETKIE